MNLKIQLPRIEDYEPLVGVETIERILKKAGTLKGFHVANINSTYYGGGVAELLSSLTLLLNGLGMPRFLEQHLDLFSSFESSFRHVGCCARSTWSPEHKKLFCP